MSISQDQGHVIITGSQGVENRGADEVVFEARPGDTLRFFTSSGSNNFEQIAVIEDIRFAEGDEILKDFAQQTFERTGVAPHSNTDVLPARLVQQQFRLSRCLVVCGGTGRYDLVVALYDRNEEAQPRLIGRYRWAIQLTANIQKGENP